MAESNEMYVTCDQSTLTWPLGQCTQARTATTRTTTTAKRLQWPTHNISVMNKKGVREQKKKTQQN